MEELLRVEQANEALRVDFANIANSVRNYVDEKTSELGTHEGNLETQLAALEALQEDYNAKKSDMEAAAAAAEAQDAAGVIVNVHTPETFETLRAAWNGLGGVYTKAPEAISSQILAEQTAGLTPEQIAEANDVFDEFDVDGNGDLNLQEFHDCCTSLGLLLDKDEAAVKHAQLDDDSSGRVEKGEFLSFYADELTHSSSEADITEAFSKLAGGNSYITPAQLSQHFNDAELLQYLEAAMDTNEDGNYDYATFTENMYNTSKAHTDGDLLPPQQEQTISSLERNHHKRTLSQRAMGVPKTHSFLDETVLVSNVNSIAKGWRRKSMDRMTEEKETVAESKAESKPKNRRKSWVMAKTEEGEAFYYDDPSLGGTGETTWDEPEHIVGEYVEPTTEVVYTKVAQKVEYNEEW